MEFSETPDGRAASAETERPFAFFRSNRGIATILSAITLGLLLYILFGGWAFRELRDGFLLGGFPLFAVAMMAVSVLILLIDGQSRFVEPGLAAFSLTAGLVIFAAAAVLGLMFLSFDYIGFVPAVTLLVIGISAVLGYRPLWSSAIVGLLVAAILRTIMYALGVDMADGLIWSFLNGLLG